MSRCRFRGMRAARLSWNSKAVLQLLFQWNVEIVGEFLCVNYNIYIISRIILENMFYKKK